MSYASESDMYPDVLHWLERFLADRLPSCSVEVRDTHASPLNQIVAREGLHDYFGDDVWQTFEIRVDVTAFLMCKQTPALVFVECKTAPISLRHVSQVLGYSRVALPLLSYLISSAGIGDAVKALILRYERTDVLEYDWPPGALPRTLIIGRWDKTAKHIDASSILPPGIDPSTLIDL